MARPLAAASRLGSWLFTRTDAGQPDGYASTGMQGAPPSTGSSTSHLDLADSRRHDEIRPPLALRLASPWSTDGQGRSGPGRRPVRAGGRTRRRSRLHAIDDHLWVRILDVPPATSRLAPTASMPASLEVVDDFRPWDGRPVPARGRRRRGPTALAHASEDCGPHPRHCRVGSLVLGGIAASGLAAAGPHRRPHDRRCRTGADALLATPATAVLRHSASGADNASIQHLVVSGDDWKLRCFNDTAQLGPFTTEPEATWTVVCQVTSVRRSRRPVSQTMNTPTTNGTTTANGIVSVGQSQLPPVILREDQRV